MLNWSQTEQVLEGIFKTLSTPCLVGPHGIGKTSFIKAYAEKHGYEFVSFRLGQCSDVGDVLGRMVEVDGRSAYLPPEVFPQGSKPILLFLDEINRTNKDLLQYIFEVIEPTEPKRLGSYRLPEGSRVVAAMNPDDGNYIVNGFDDKAFWSRLVRLEVMPTNDEFLEFVPVGDVKDFFSAHRELISDRRAITQFAIMHQAGLGFGTQVVAAAMLGAATAGIMMAWLADKSNKVFELADVLKGRFDNNLDLSARMQISNLLRDAVANGRNTWSKSECGALKKFFMQLEPEAFNVLVKDLAKGSPLYTSYLYQDKDLHGKFGDYVSADV